MSSFQDSRRRFMSAAGAGALAFGTPLIARAQPSAQPWPTRPINLIVGFAPGGITDALARMVAQLLSEELRQPVVVDNRAGASSTIATAVVAAAPRDGYSFLVVSNGHVHNKLLIKGIRYDPIADFEPVAGIAQNPLVVLVNGSSRYRSFQDLVVAGRAPGGVSYGSGGVGTLPHLIPELLASGLKTDFVHVAYRGGAPAIADLLGGQVAFVMDLLQTSLPYLQSGKLRAVIVSSKERAAQLPDVPTLSESLLPGFDAQGFYGLLAPAGTPKDIVTRMHDAVEKVMRRPDVIEKLRAVGSTPFKSTPAEFMNFIRDDGRRWSELITTLKIQPE